MNSISTAAHFKFCKILQMSITDLENEDVCELAKENILELKRDLEVLIAYYNQYSLHVKEIRRIASNYNAIEKRARITLRKEQLRREKIKIRKTA